MVAETKGTRMNTKALAVAASLWVPMVATAATEASVTERQEALSAQLEQILSKTGISIGGSFRGEAGSSVLKGNGSEPTRRDDEQIGFTSVDFDIRARPNTSTTARAVFRMHLDHPNFFGSPYTPLQTRWLSMDGGFFDMGYYHLGNMQMKWSPLVIGATEPGFLYTPRIFAQQQKQAMDERFIGGGVRNLQGVNLGLRAAVPNLQIDSFDVSLLAAKLLSAAAIGEVASISTSAANFNGDALQGSPVTAANFDRWSLGSKGSVAFLHGLTVGTNYLKTMDLRSTYGTKDTAKLIRRTISKSGKVLWANTAAGPSSEVVRDSIIQNGSVFSVNLGAKIGSVISNPNLIADLDVEFAHSGWDYYSERDMDVDSVVNDSVSLGYFKPKYSTKSGNALNIGVSAGWKAESWVAKVRGGFLMNDSLFRSDLAQASVFNPALGRVYNSEQDVYDAISNTYTGLRHYNTFDALYHSVHRYVPEDKNEYAKSPYDKIAYTNYVGGGVSASLGGWTAAAAMLSDDYIASVVDNALAADSATKVNTKKAMDAAKLALYSMVEGGVIDRDLQLVLPAGEASPNRVGPKFGLDFDLMQGGVEVKVDGYMLQEAKGSVVDSFNQATAEKAKFQQIQAGVRIRADRFISGWDKPIELSGSVGQSTAKGGASLNYQSTAINAGLYAGVIKRLAVLAGYQLIDGKDKAFLVDRKQSNLAGGLEFKIQEGAYLLGMYNLIKTEFPNATEYNFDQNLWSTKISVSF